MKITYKNLGVISVTLFVISIFLILYMLYALPADVNVSLRAIDKARSQEVGVLITRLSIVVGVGLTTGLLAILFLLLGSGKQIEQQIVYVKQEVSRDNQENVQQAQIAASEIALKEQTARLQRIDGVFRAEKGKEMKSSLERILRELCTELEACQGAIFLTNESDGKRFIEFYVGYAYYVPESQSVRYEFGEGLSGQVAREGRLVNIQSVPDKYITILSGLGKSSPNHLLITPIKVGTSTHTAKGDQSASEEGGPEEKTSMEDTISHAKQEAVAGIIEIASFRAFSEYDEQYIRQVSSQLATLLYELVPTRASA